MEKLPIVIAGVLLGVAVGLSSQGNHFDPDDDPWFQSAVIQNSRPVVVKFGADWCPPCRSMDKALQKVKGGFPAARFVTINIDEKPKVFQSFSKGSGIPQVAVFRDGEVIARTRGFGGEEALREWLSDVL